MIRQQFVPWWEWECYKNGMWRKLPKEQEEAAVKSAVDFTGDWEQYGAAMQEVSMAWPRTMLNSLSNVSINRRAFIGHCAATFKIGAPEYITRMAWAELTNEQRFYADREAEKYIKQWLHHHARTDRTLHTKVGRQMLLWGDSGHGAEGDIRPRAILSQDRPGHPAERCNAKELRVRAA